MPPTIENCALYLFQDKPSLKDQFPKGRTDGGLFKAATWFEFDCDAGPVRLNLQHADLAQHLRGFSAYVAQLPNSGAARARAQALIKEAKAALGVALPQPVALDSAVVKSLLAIAARFGGFLFAANGIMLADGSFLVGPLAQDEPDAAPDVAIREVDPEQYRHRGNTGGVDPARVAAREAAYRTLAERGFRCARSLPLYRNEDGDGPMRPADEIASRLLALNALFIWTSAPEQAVASGRVKAFIERNALRAHLSGEERAILELPREKAKAEHGASIGWRLENMWPLAWIFGFEPAPAFYVGQMPQDIVHNLLFEFLPDLGASVAQFLADKSVRPVQEVGHLEDIFYCAHNAVRSAQGGSDSVPQDFHPVRDGGAVHERRHALTWAMSPGVDWDETDLST